MSEKPRPKPLALDQRIAKFAARGLARLPVTPNMVTGTSILVGVLAAGLFAQGGAVAYWGAGVFVVVVWMDHVDGELARQTGTTSEFGHYFDHAAAMLNYVMMFVGAGFGLSEGIVGISGLLLGIGAGIGVAAIMSVRVYAEERISRSFVKQTVRAGFEIEDVLYIVAPITWVGLLDYFILLAGIGAPLFLLYVIWDCRREMRHQGNNN
ncbi:MAG: CDP-alcohol phosphatidyltransferase family protein [Alphaproteobacteria bacterium]|jgi:archaetidylinositol phosphate synthase|nr:CDP-alcohol phosphatidyltransferase family protein [Alphaproteobacteria bacterium]